MFSLSSLKAQVHNAIITGNAGTEIPYLILAVAENYGINPVTDTIRIAKDKTFKYHVKIKRPGLVYLGYGNRKLIILWLRPGNLLNVDLQKNMPELKGPDAVFANYYIDDKNFWIKICSDYQKRNPHFDNADNRYTDKYFTIQDSITNERRNFLKNYFPVRTNKDVQEFIKQQNLSFLYMDLYYKLTFDGSDIEKFKFYQNKYNITRPDFQIFSDKVEFKNTGLLSIEYYREFFCMVVGEIARKRIKQHGEKFSFNTYIDLCMSVIDELTAGANTNIELKAIFLNDLEIEIRMKRDLKMADKVIAILDSLSSGHTNNNSLKIVKAKLDKIITDTKFIEGAKAPDFAFKDIYGKTYNLNDFKGKKIYIDMGASWCGPCIAGIPAWNKFVEDNKNNESVIFISLSLDDTEKEWKIFLSKHPVNGMRLFAGGGFKGSFATSYSIIGIPHFMLIDENGKILRYAAPYPDSEEISAFLQKNK